MILTPRQQAGLVAATAAVNQVRAAANLPLLTPDDYLGEIIAPLLEGYADEHKVGLVTPYAFVELFVREGVYDAIVEASKSDKAIAGYLAALRAKTDVVNLYSPTVTQGLAYLQQSKLVSADQAARVVAGP